MSNTENEKRLKQLKAGALGTWGIPECETAEVNYILGILNQPLLSSQVEDESCLLPSIGNGHKENEFKYLTNIRKIFEQGKCKDPAKALEAIYLPVGSRMAEPVVWAVAQMPSQVTPVISKEAASLIEERKLEQEIDWLKTNTRLFFPTNHSEIDIIYGEEEGEENSLVMRIYSALPSGEFRETKHSLFDSMRWAGNNKLAEILGIYQKSPTGYGWQGISFYGSTPSCAR